MGEEVLAAFSRCYFANWRCSSPVAKVPPNWVLNNFTKTSHGLHPIATTTVQAHWRGGSRERNCRRPTPPGLFTRRRFLHPVQAGHGVSRSEPISSRLGPVPSQLSDFALGGLHSSAQCYLHRETEESRRRVTRTLPAGHLEVGFPWHDCKRSGDLWVMVPLAGLEYWLRR
jgi:hypothetical protein